MDKIFMIPVVSFILIVDPAFSQTCCSGGVPLTGNIGFSSSDRGSWQFSLSYDRNALNTLKAGRMDLADQTRLRTTQSVLLETGWQFSELFSISGLLTYVFQRREISGSFETTTDLINGPGDAAFLFYIHPGVYLGDNRDFVAGLGSKVPLGRTSISNRDGIIYNADLQPGSGSFDAIIWGHFTQGSSLRPSTVLSARTVYRFSGVNPDYLGSITYRFGNEFQLVTGLSDQFLLGTFLLGPSLMFRYRQTGTDTQDDFELPNTGGKWLFVVPGLVIRLTENAQLNLSAEFPLYSYLAGTQLTTDYRITTGLYFRLHKDDEQQYF